MRADECDKIWVFWETEARQLQVWAQFGHFSNFTRPCLKGEKIRFSNILVIVKHWSSYPSNMLTLRKEWRFFFFLPTVPFDLPVWRWPVYGASSFMTLVMFSYSPWAVLSSSCGRHQQAQRTAPQPGSRVSYHSFREGKSSQKSSGWLTRAGLGISGAQHPEFLG